MRQCGKGKTIYRGDKSDEAKIKYLLLSFLILPLPVSQSIHTSFAQQRLGKLAYGRFERQCESGCSFARNPSVKPQSLLKFTRVEEVWRVVGKNTFGCPKLKVFSFTWDYLKASS